MFLLFVSPCVFLCSGCWLSEWAIPCRDAASLLFREVWPPVLRCAAVLCCRTSVFHFLPIVEKSFNKKQHLNDTVG